MNRQDLKKLGPILEAVGTPEALRIAKKIEKELKPISPQARKAKGRGFQQDVCKVLSEKTGIKWGYDNYEIQPRLMGGSGTDVLLIGRARDAIPFDIECKNTESFSLAATVDQAKANNKSNDRHWLICHKRKGMKPVAIMDMEAFFNLVLGEKE